jgi:NAD-dependent DNA ligase
VDTDEIKSLITRRRRQVLVHSCLYYKFNTTLISDHTYDAWARELMELQRKYPDIAAECAHADAFADWSETTSGFNLPLYGWVQTVAERCLRYHEMEAK